MSAWNFHLSCYLLILVVRRKSHEWLCSYQTSLRIIRAREKKALGRKLWNWVLFAEIFSCLMSELFSAFFFRCDGKSSCDVLTELYILSLAAISCNNMCFKTRLKALFDVIAIHRKKFWTSTNVVEISFMWLVLLQSSICHPRFMSAAREIWIKNDELNLLRRVNIFIHSTLEFCDVFWCILQLIKDDIRRGLVANGWSERINIFREPKLSSTTRFLPLHVAL